jgi:hypothetical protein
MGAISPFRSSTDLYQPPQSLRVRLHDSTDFTTTLSTRVILEFTLQGHKQTTLSVVLPEARCPGQHIVMQSRYTGDVAFCYLYGFHATG